MKYEIWSEGYSATGQQSGAVLLGEADAESFKKAVVLFINGLTDDKKAFYNIDRLTYWGCRLFDNEKDARESFG